MTKQTEALKLALEALKDLQLHTDDYYESSHEASKKGDKAITAIREALAEPSEALALVNEVDQEQPAQRPWVGLTEEDIDIAFDDTQEGGGFDDFARAIEAKLREKNSD